MHQDKEEKWCANFENGAQEIEEMIYGKESYFQKFGFMNTQICLAYLIRIEPFWSLYIQYNGKLDHSERMFSCWLNQWNKVFKASPQWNSELIPEWFYLPQLFKNNNYWYFGKGNKNNTVHDVVLPQWAKGNPFYFWMKYREFIEDPQYTKELNHWLDITFGKRQQSKEDMNIFFSYATPDYYEKISEEEIRKNQALVSATEFYQLPAKIFYNNHSVSNAKEANRGRDESPIKNISNINDEIRKEEIKVRSNWIILNRPYGTDHPFPSMKIKTGIIKDDCNIIHLVWKINKLVPLISIHKNKKEIDNSCLKQKVTFEVEAPKDDLVFCNHYISQFSLNKNDYIVIGRLVTSNFVVVNVNGETRMKWEYFGLDALTNTVTSIHWSKDNKSIIAGYETGSIAIWEINSSSLLSFNSSGVSIIINIFIAKKTKTHRRKSRSS